MKLFLNRTLTPALAAALLAAAVAPAPAALLRSADSGFSLDVPGKWQSAAPAGGDVVLQARNGKAEIKVRAVPAQLDEAARKAKLQGLQKKLKKGGITPSKVYSVESGASGVITFVQFVSKGKRFQSGYFYAGGRTYNFLLTDLSTPEFRSVPATLTALDAEETEQPAPRPKAQAAPSAPTAAAQPPAQAPAVVEENRTQSPPAASTDTLAAPPASAFGEGAAQPQGELPALPERRVGGALYLFLLAAALSAAVLGYRVVVGRGRQEEPEPAVPGSPYPFQFSKRYLSLRTVFDVKDASGQEYRAVAPRWPSLLLGGGMLLYFLLKAAVQALAFVYLDLKEAPGIMLLAVVNLLSLSNLMIIAGALLYAMFRTKMKLFDAEGALLVDICQKRMSFGSYYYFVRDAAGNEVARIKRAGFVLIRRRWQLLDPQGGVMLDILEDSAGKALARKLLGHLWGLLRTNYSVSDDKAGVGEIRRDWSVWNRGRLRMTMPPGLDPKLVLATALFMDVVDPDRWYPWYS